jgi:argonaute-like protein implicated in RNA metabolism and viral defense
VICEVLGKHIKELKVMYGYQRGFIDYNEKRKRKIKMEHLRHSWLETPDGAIIEPYPPGFLSLQPLLYPKRCKFSTYGHSLYVPHQQVREKVMDEKLKRYIGNLHKRLKRALAKEQS